jgi:hypothetical protein
MRRLFCCFRILFSSHVLVLEARKDPKRRGYNIKLYGSMADPPEQVHILRKMALDIECGLTLAERQKLATLQ